MQQGREQRTGDKRWVPSQWPIMFGRLSAGLAKHSRLKCWFMRKQCKKSAYASCLRYDPEDSSLKPGLNGVPNALLRLASRVNGPYSPV